MDCAKIISDCEVPFCSHGNKATCNVTYIADNVDFHQLTKIVFDNESSSLSPILCLLYSKSLFAGGAREGKALSLEGQTST